MHGRSRMTVDPRIPTMPERSHRPGGKTLLIVKLVGLVLAESFESIELNA